MGPAGRYVLRSTGCGTFAGILLLIIAAAIAFSNTPWHYRRWWPIVIVAFGVYLLARNYWLLYRRRSAVPEIIDVGIIPKLQGQGRSWSPPAFPIVIIAIGACWLLVNLSVAQQWVIWVVVLVALGFLLLAGNLRANFQRR